jgi:hypothetical protein
MVAGAFPKSGYPTVFLDFDGCRVVKTYALHGSSPISN